MAKRSSVRSQGVRRHCGSLSKTLVSLSDRLGSPQVASSTSDRFFKAQTCDVQVDTLATALGTIVNPLRLVAVLVLANIGITLR